MAKRVWFDYLKCDCGYLHRVPRPGTLRKVRQECKVSRKQMAQFSGVSIGDIERVERGALKCAPWVLAEYQRLLKPHARKR